MLATSLYRPSSQEAGKYWFETHIKGDIVLPLNEPQYEIKLFHREAEVVSPPTAPALFFLPSFSIPFESCFSQMANIPKPAFKPEKATEEDRDLIEITEEEFKAPITRTLKRCSTQGGRSPTGKNIEEKIAQPTEDGTEIPECCVCYSKEDLMTSKCKHLCCKTCWMAWLKKRKSCPLCRTKTNSRILTRYPPSARQTKPRQRKAK